MKNILAINLIPVMDCLCQYSVLFGYFSVKYLYTLSVIIGFGYVMILASAKAVEQVVKGALTGGMLRP